MNAGRTALVLVVMLDMPAAAQPPTPAPPFAAAARAAAAQPRLHSLLAPLDAPRGGG